MTTTAEFKTKRDTAGARYATALAELKAAYIDLSALDRTLANRNVDPDGDIFQSFYSGGVEQVRASLTHPTYAPAMSAEHWGREAEGQFQIYLASHTPG